MQDLVASVHECRIVLATVSLSKHPLISALRDHQSQPEYTIYHQLCTWGVQTVHTQGSLQYRDCHSPFRGFRTKVLAVSKVSGRVNQGTVFVLQMLLTSPLKKTSLARLSEFVGTRIVSLCHTCFTAVNRRPRSYFSDRKTLPLRVPPRYSLSAPISANSPLVWRDGMLILRYDG